MLLRTMRHAARQLRKSPGFLLTGVLTLALGMGATTAIYTALEAVLLRALPYANADRVVAITDVNQRSAIANGITSPSRCFDVQARAKTLEKSMFFYFGTSTLLDGAKDPVHLTAVGTSGDYFAVLGASPLLGRLYTSADDQANSPDVTVLSYATWQRVYGRDPRVIGRHVTIDDKPSTIIGVMPKSFDFPHAVDAWRPNRLTPALVGALRKDRYVGLYGLRKEGVSLRQVRAEMDTIAAQLAREYPETDGEWRFHSDSLRARLYGSLAKALEVLMAAAGAVLLIACLNIANLLLARAVARQRTVAVQRALGASRGQLMAQFCAESGLLCVLGTACGLLLAELLLQALVRLAPAGMVLSRLHLHINPYVLAFAAAVCLLTTIVFGLVPMLQTRNLDLAGMLKAGETRTGGGSLGRAGDLFIAVQVAVSLALLVGAGLLGRTLWNLQSQPLGFVPEHVLTFDAPLAFGIDPQKVESFFDEVERRVSALPGVKSVGQVTARPLTNFMLRNTFDIDGRPRTLKMDTVQAEARSIHGDYLGAMGIPLLAGRALNDRDSQNGAPRVAVVNEQFVRQYFPNENPIGKRLVDQQGSVEIVGVAHDMRGMDGALGDRVNAQVLRPSDGYWPEMNFVVRASGNPELLTQAIRAQIRQVDASKAMGDVATLDSLVNDSLAQPRVNTSLLVAFALLATLLAAVGIYGVIAYSVTRRTQEIGVRMALGASRSHIARLFLARVTRWAAAGAVAGLALAWGGARLLTTELYGVGATDASIYLGTLLMLALPVLAASWWPARRAAMTEPSQALRNE